LTVAGKLKYTVADVGVGWVGLLASGSGLLRVTLPQTSAEEAERLLSDRVTEAVRSDNLFADLTERLKSYFSGQRVSFDDELDLSGATAFQGEVWRLARLIPYGQTRSYRWLVQSLGKAGAGRAVGQALARNPLPVIVPCHRVVAQDGKPGGYSGGIDRKKFLLRLESAAI
jgi:methylated-DNA-[protein]-cysteine S-methyltransferase